MAEITWPQTLPLTLRMEGLSAKRNSAVIRTTMDAGPRKTRRRYTASVKIYTGTMFLDAAGRSELEQFYTTALADGVLRFNFTDPQTLEFAEFRFTENYTENSADGMFKITMSLERLS
ncbi:MAG: hypothetical protein FWD24_01040 [Treponema sp.]|nr:hypothetical protein [Treponema sp.]